MRFTLTLECYFLIGDNKMIDKTKITNFANSIKNFVTQEITNHANITANSSTKGHVQAGGIPQNISTTASAGTDNGYYARADHVHKASFNNLADKPATFTPSAHNHTISNITNLQTSLSDKSDKDHTHSQQDVSFVGSTEIWQGLGSNKNIGQAIEYVMNLFDNHNHFNEIYPVGSIYMSVNSTNPSTLFGGTWVQIKDTFLLACGDSYTSDGNVATAQHGSADAVVVSHNHTQNAHNHDFSGHHVPCIGDVNWQYTSKKQMNSTSGSYYYPYSTSNTDGIGEITGTGNKTPTNNATGVEGTGKNMPPYMAVYMWKRTV